VGPMTVARATSRNHAQQDSRFTRVVTGRTPVGT
jgi:hypothetical protein